MKTQLKSSLLLLSIFGLGIIFGLVLDRTFVEYQMKSRFKRLREPRMIGHLLERIIQPAPEQQKRIREILAKYSQQMDETRRQVMKQSAVIMDSLQQDLAPILTEEQKSRLEEHRKRFERWEKRRGELPPGMMRRPFDEPPPGPLP